MPGPAITVAILAGGAASRLNHLDKGLYPLQGRPLIDWVMTAITAMAGHGGEGRAAISRIDPLIIANRNQPVYAGWGRTVGDYPDYGTGPLAGVASALRSSQTEWLMTVPVDCPDPPGDLAERLFVAVGTADGSVVHDGEHTQPLFALYRRTLAESAAAAARGGQGPFQWQRSLTMIPVDFSDCHRRFSNLNTIEDFAHYRGEIP